MYGDSKKMAIDQKLHKSILNTLAPPLKQSHAHPAEMPDVIMKQKEKHVPTMAENEMICTNWGCKKEYMADRNEYKVCQHHPGRFEFGSEQGLWGEGWTCCRQEWDS